MHTTGNCYSNDVMMYYIEIQYILQSLPIKNTRVLLGRSTRELWMENFILGMLFIRKKSALRIVGH